MSLTGPTPTTSAVQQVVGYLGYSGRDADVVVTAALDPEQSAPGKLAKNRRCKSPTGRSSQPPRPRVMHEVLSARRAVKRSQGRPRAKY